MCPRGKDQKGQKAAVPGLRELYTWRELEHIVVRGVNMTLCVLVIGLHVTSTTTNITVTGTRSGS